MNQIPYDKQMTALIDGLGERVPALLLHGCCAPCSSAVLERLSGYFSITLYYYNPNISTKEEYDKRLEEVRRLLAAMTPKHPISLRWEEWDHTAFLKMAKGLEHAPEGGVRCHRCYEMRMDKAAQTAKQFGYEYFTSTLSISPLKNAEKLNEIGEKAGEKWGVKHLPSDFKKRDGYKRSVELSKEYGLYRQDFCGCEFSKKTASN